MKRVHITWACFRPGPDALSESCHQTSCAASRCRRDDGGFVESSIPASNIAAIPLDVLRVFLQNGTVGTAVTELAWGSNGWEVGKAALPPA